jgi:hypothetical protein
VTMNGGVRLRSSSPGIINRRGRQVGAAWAGFAIERERSEEQAHRPSRAPGVQK